MRNAYDLRHRNGAILDLARALQPPLAGLPDFPPLHRIGVRQRGLVPRPRPDGHPLWFWARWSLVPPGSREVPPYPRDNVRADKLDAWPWKATRRQRCLTAASGFWEPEKRARAKGTAPWSYYRMADGRAFFMAGLWAEAHDPATGEVTGTYTLIVTDANAAMRVHDRMPAILPADAARHWVEPGPLPAELLAPYPAEGMTAWRVGDDAKNSRVESHPRMAEPVAAIIPP